MAFLHKLFDSRTHLKYYHRLLSSNHGRDGWKARKVRLIAKFLMRTVNGCEISGSAVLAESVFFPHPLGIVIGDGVTVGAGTMIWQHVTLGSHGKAGAEPEYPVIGKNVRIYCNSVIIGGITIGDGAVIGACSLVLRDVAPGETVAGIPAKVVRTKSSETQG